MKLAYIPFDARKLKFYMTELVALDDIFLLFTTVAPRAAGPRPDTGARKNP